MKAVRQNEWSNDVKTGDTKENAGPKCCKAIGQLGPLSLAVLLDSWGRRWWRSIGVRIIGIKQSDHHYFIFLQLRRQFLCFGVVSLRVQMQ